VGGSGYKKEQEKRLQNKKRVQAKLDFVSIGLTKESNFFSSSTARG
jgi:hypothetical protein